jgi:hypothetical protein
MATWEAMFAFGAELINQNLTKKEEKNPRDIFFLQIKPKLKSRNKRKKDCILEHFLPCLLHVKVLLQRVFSDFLKQQVLLCETQREMRRGRNSYELRNIESEQIQQKIFNNNNNNNNNREEVE